MITGSVAGLLDGILIIVAYLLYPIVIVIFGFFYIFYGSILYIFGPIVIALMPLGATNRIAKAYIENVFIWNAWPILYGGFGALLTAVQMGQVGQMLNQNDFLGGLGNLEGSFLIGIASIIFSLAIAVIPFIAKRIVTGDVGSTAGAMIGAAVTALTVGAAAVEGAAAGLAAGGGGTATGTSASAGSSGATAGSARTSTASAGANQPAPAQQSPKSSASASSKPANAFSMNASEPSAESHAEQIRGSLSDAMGIESNEDSGAGVEASSAEDQGSGGSSASTVPKPGGRPTVPSAGRKGPSVHRYNLGTWGTYHVARLATQSLAGAAKSNTDQD